MAFEILGKTRDIRSETDVIYCKCTVDEYLDLIGDEYKEFLIQRKIETHKAYQRLKSDLQEGALLPSITLAVKYERVSEIISALDNKELLAERLNKKDIVDILDGLQRTHIMKQLKDAGTIFKEGQEVLLEYWIEPELSKLIYRMIVLNAGQKAMSMRHQIELLFMSLHKVIEEKISNVEIILDKNNQRRSQPNKYPLASIATAYQAYVTGSTEIDQSNVVSQGLNNSNVMDSNEAELTEDFVSFIGYFTKLKEIDEKAWAYYHELSTSRSERFEELKNSTIELNEEEKTELENLKNMKNAYTWLGNDNTLIGFFSAISNLKKRNKEERIREALEILEGRFDRAEEDPLGIRQYTLIKSGISPRKHNVGYATRKLLKNGFKEFFMDTGDLPLEEYWEDEE